MEVSSPKSLSRWVYDEVRASCSNSTSTALFRLCHEITGACSLSLALISRGCRNCSMSQLFSADSLAACAELAACPTSRRVLRERRRGPQAAHFLPRRVAGWPRSSHAMPATTPARERNSILRKRSRGRVVRDLPVFDRFEESRLDERWGFSARLCAYLFGSRNVR